MNEIIINLLLIIGGATGQFILSAFILPKKDKKDADAQFIETLISRVTLLEGRIEEQSKQVSNLMASNATLSVELNFIRQENDELKEELRKEKESK